MNIMNIMNSPLEVELVIYKYLHELHMNDVRREISRNIKTSIIYELKWKGFIYNNTDGTDETDEIYDKEYDTIMSDKNISSLYFRNKLEKILFDCY